LRCHGTVAVVQSNSAFAARGGCIVGRNSLRVVVTVPELYKVFDTALVAYSVAVSYCISVAIARIFSAMPMRNRL
jgi:hypothetical protein